MQDKEGKSEKGRPGMECQGLHRITWDGNVIHRVEGGKV